MRALNIPQMEERYREAPAVKALQLPVVRQRVLVQRGFSAVLVGVQRQLHRYCQVANLLRELLV